MYVLLTIFCALVAGGEATHRHLYQEQRECPATSWSMSTCLERPEFTPLSNNAQTPSRGAVQVAPLMASVTYAGGAQDIENFRENIKQGYLPLPTDITFGGVVKDYYFDTTSQGTAQPCTELFCPVYSAASTADPLVVAAFQGPCNATDLFLAVGLDSGLQASEAKRKVLNLVLLLDYSGSMSSSFDTYYYDQFGNQKNLTQEELQTPKIEVAKQVLTGILDKLGPDDQVSIVLFDDSACTPFPLTPVSCLDVNNLKAEINRDIQTAGGTNQEAGLAMATDILTNCSDCLSKGLANVENRIILLTDEQPNTGDISKEGLGKMIRDNAQKNIFLTLIGIGLDLNTELVDALSTTRGANHFSVHSPGEFQKRLVDEFDYAVTPLVFDLELAVDPGSINAAAGEGGQGWRILSVYGSPNPNDTALSALGGNGTVSRVNTLFPSPKSEEGIKGGVILLRMAAPPGGISSVPLTLDASYTDRNGQKFTTKKEVALPQEVLTVGSGPFYQSTGVRKAVLLARYTDLFRNWLIDEWRQINNASESRMVVVPANLCSVFPSEYCREVSGDPYRVTRVAEGCDLGNWITPRGCILPTPLPVIFELSQWERQSQNLTGHVDTDAKQAIAEFLPYFESEMNTLKDQELQQEVDIMEKVVAA